MTKKEKIAELKKIRQRKIDWEKRMIEQYGEDSIPDVVKEMNAKEIAELDEFIAEFENSGRTEGRKRAAQKATEARVERAKQKIQNAINLLKLEGRKITPYQVSKTSGVCYATVKRHLDNFLQ